MTYADRIKALKERENHKTILKNKRKAKNGTSQSSSKAGIHGRRVESQSGTYPVNSWRLLHFRSRWSRKAPKLSPNPRKSQKLSQKLKKNLEMIKNVMKWDFMQGSTIPASFVILVTFWCCWLSCHPVLMSKTSLCHNGCATTVVAYWSFSKDGQNDASRSRIL